MLDEARRAVQQVIESTARFWAGERAVARKFFGGPVSFAEAHPDHRWLTYQIHKEWYGGGVYGPGETTVRSIIEEASRAILQSDRAGEFHRIDHACSMLRFATDELRHYCLLGKLYAELTDNRSFDLDAAGQLLEGQRLVTLRQDSRATVLGKTAVVLSEGGGLGLFFGIAEVLGVQRERSPGEGHLLRVVQQILDDEKGHLAGNFRRAAAQHSSVHEWAQIGEILAEISKQKLRERCQQFDIPLTDDLYSSAVAGTNDWPDFIRSSLGFLYAALDLPHGSGVAAPQLTPWLAPTSQPLSNQPI
ncbi:hypothetical protein WKR88_08485 [Trinickia caryophylli]|uniref:Ferritin-like domain-containing protein n=1 Tax=Trinickia caryophylli TaxID=28094 RepID=A0A1X7EE81_TRICW|nr:hypothetical protein [Trinickia caryophylli]PMS11143.1 hypothetical protein C0Z17_16845 [Trinickia caryophylli]TRX14602.1 hypothetical protein FNF07_25470 [Trinickia caryophylli]WQE14444.1 hypothetical protein U0034_27660 [Trinickia caryophylli]SMF32400.1 hypothetical protein SAMN06295900_105269 [Trinickia caryophylli]GLU32153.1 hypothetical protein Busp01_19950 [Trinickia caryophylli]